MLAVWKCSREFKSLSPQPGLGRAHSGSCRALQQNFWLNWRGWKYFRETPKLSALGGFPFLTARGSDLHSPPHRVCYWRYKAFESLPGNSINQNCKSEGFLLPELSSAISVKKVLRQLRLVCPKPFDIYFITGWTALPFNKFSSDLDFHHENLYSELLVYYTYLKRVI